MSRMRPIELLDDQDGMIEYINLATRSPDGKAKRLGLGLKGGKDRTNRDLGVFVTEVLPGTAAELDGRLQADDRIISVNGVSLMNVPNDRATRMINDSVANSETVELVVEHSTPLRTRDDSFRSHRESLSPRSSWSRAPSYRRREDSLRAPTPQHGMSSPVSMRTPAPRGQVQHVIQVPVTADLGLGFAVTGGPDSVVAGPVRVQAVDAYAPVGADGKLKAGDHIIEVDGRPVGTLSQTALTQVLETAVARAGQGQQTIDIVHQGRTLGLALSGGDGHPIVISRILAGSAAERDGRVHPGMELLAVDGHDVQGLKRTRAVSLLARGKLQRQKLSTSLTVRTSMVTLTVLRDAGTSRLHRHASFGTPAHSLAGLVAQETGAMGPDKRFKLQQLLGALRVDGQPVAPEILVRIKELIQPDVNGYVDYQAFMHVARKLIGKALGTAGGTPSRSHVGISLEDVEGELESSMNQATQARSRLALARSRHEQSVLEHEVDDAMGDKNAAMARAKLAEAARDSARAVEQDYEEIVALLEAEIAHLRAQFVAGAGDKDIQLMNLRRRVVVLGVQLNKAVQARNTQEAITKRLLDFTRKTVSTLRKAKSAPRTADKSLNLRKNGTLRHRPSDGRLPPSTPWAVGDTCRAPWLEGDELYYTALIQSMDPPSSSADRDTCVVRFLEYETEPVTQVVPVKMLLPLADQDFVVANARAGDLRERSTGVAFDSAPGFLTSMEQNLCDEAEDVLETSLRMIEAETLPFGWEEAYTEDGDQYFIDHVNQTTSWSHPLSRVDRGLGRLGLAEESGV